MDNSSNKRATLPTDTEVDHPYPPRRRWFKRIWLWCAIALLLLGMSRWWWGYEADRRLQRELDQIAKRGEPVYPEELNPKNAIPDERNAARYYIKAIGMLNPNVQPPGNSPKPLPTYPPYSAEWHQMIDQAVSANAPVFPLAREARKCKQGDWGFRFSNSYPFQHMGHVSSACELSVLIADAAVREHLHGNHAAALELIRDGLHLAEITSVHPGVVPHLTRSGMQALMLNRLMVIAPGLKIQDESSGQTSTDLATDEQMKQLIAELLDETSHRRSMQDAVIAERTITTQACRILTPRTPLVRPMFDLDSVRTLKFRDDFLPIVTQSDYPSALPLMKPYIRDKESDHSYARYASQLLRSSYDTFFEHEMYTLNERRMAAISLAVQMYRADHQRWPRSLDDLVPDYLPHVPLDAFTKGNRLKYTIGEGGLPDGRSRPLVYSVDKDGKDEISIIKKVPSIEPIFMRRWNQSRAVGPKDQWRDLSRWAPPQKSAETLDNEAGVSDQEGDEEKAQ